MKSLINTVGMYVTLGLGMIAVLVWAMGLLG
jgi:hypothetical protein